MLLVTMRAYKQTKKETNDFQFKRKIGKLLIKYEKCKCIFMQPICACLLKRRFRAYLKEETEIE